MVYMILYCVTYAKFTTAKKHIQVLPYKGILSSVTVTNLILPYCSFYFYKDNYMQKWVQVQMSIIKIKNEFL